MENVTIIATSLNEDSKSQVLARKFEQQLVAAGIQVELMDLRELKLPFSGTKESWSSPADVIALKQAVERASHVIFAVPIYCYDVNAAAKNIVELIGRSFTKKIVGFICAAGGSGSYMSVMGMANHLMLDFRSVIVPRFLYVQSSDWNDEGVLNPEIDERFRALQADMTEISVADA